VDCGDWRQKDRTIRPECPRCQTAADEAKLTHSCPAEFRCCDTSVKSITETPLWISGLRNSDASHKDVLFPSSSEGSLIRTNSDSSAAQKKALLPRPANAADNHEFAPVHQQQRQLQQQQLGGSGGGLKLPLFCLQQSSLPATAVDIGSRKAVTVDGTHVNSPQAQVELPKPLRVRDVVSRLEQQHDASQVLAVGRRRALPLQP